MVDLILRDSDTGEPLATIRTSLTFANANEQGVAFNISEIHGLKEEDLDSQMKKEVSYALGRGQIYTIAEVKALAVENNLYLSMLAEDGEEIVLAEIEEPTTTTTAVQPVTTTTQPGL